ncbi:hypothetical protein [Roseisolibacter sp. H3M3-2]|uniref:hypothetical protein n=1 Tax=Roseisolibacter sp. H3M3-2 TaxID=3031323 RepID=UPI0023DA158B|nr:hypothetical protein [Roseisolibacter sp. H3M3-2]MDF1505539.1 hypothetical protein [Roseisolibacter sp. H3M3-2]
MIAFTCAVLVLLGPGALQHIGIPLVPTTEQLTTWLTTTGGEAFWMTIPLMTAFYAGELAWRERDAGLGEIADAAPAPDWVPPAGKFLGLAGVLAVLQVAVLASAVVVQLRLGHRDLELGLYARVLLGLQLADYLLFAALAVAVHATVNHKQVGHLVLVVAYVLTAFGGELGIRHQLLTYGGDPGWSYSDMRGFGPFLGPVLWLKAYWGAWAVLLAVASRVLWARGTERGDVARLRLARRRLTPRVAGASAAPAAATVGLGGFVFYNTNVLHAYRAEGEAEARRVAYERAYARHADAPRPALAATRVRVELFPAEGAAELRGTHLLVNRTGAPLGAVHVATAWEVATDSLALDRPATRLVDDAALGHHAWTLATPLAPGDSVRLSFVVRHRPRGFTNAGPDASVAPGGTFLTSAWLPRVGYEPARELADAAERRLRGLPPRVERPTPDDVRGARVMVEAEVGTAADELAVAPGALRRRWTAGGRAYHAYATDAPIRDDWAVFSSRYAVREGSWRDSAGRAVRLAVLHHPRRGGNVDGMLRAMRAALDYHAARFGAYPYADLRLVGHPGSGQSLHAFPINVSFREDFALMAPSRDPRRVDFPFGIVAHEVAHQWWGNRLTAADGDGAALLSESLAWYSALGTVEAEYGRAHVERLLGVMREAYLQPHARAAPPLLQARDWLQAYRKGPFALWTLRELAGEAAVTGALRRLLDAHPEGARPLPTSRDLYRELRAATPDSMRGLLADLFERNTYWKLEVRRAEAAPAGGGAWRVALDVRARKLVVDTLGVEREVPMDERVELGVDGAAAGGADAAAPALYRGTHRIRSGAQRVVVTVRGAPARALVDPRRLLLDDEGEDNAVEVERTP